MGWTQQPLKDSQFSQVCDYYSYSMDEETKFQVLTSSFYKVAEQELVFCTQDAKNN